VRLSEGSEVEITRKIKEIWWPSPEEEEDEVLNTIRDRESFGKVKFPSLRLRLGSITKEIIGRLPFGVLEWCDGKEGIALFHRQELRRAWNLEDQGIRNVLGSEWSILGEDENSITAQHETLREDMLLEDWEAIRTQKLATKKVVVRDNQDHHLFLNLDVSKELIARQLTEHLGYTIQAEDIKNVDYSEWEGSWAEDQKMCITGFWRWTENKKWERFNVSQTNTRRDMIEQLKRLGWTLKATMLSKMQENVYF
jgi:hypothetical protein